MTTPQEWFDGIPYFTKRVWIIIITIATLVRFGVVNPYYLALVPDEIFSKFQVWRLVTAYLFPLPMSFPWVFVMAMILQYSRNFEAAECYSPRQKLDYLWVMGIGMAIFSSISFWITPNFFPGLQLLTYTAYLWSRKDPFRPISFYGFTLKAWHTPLIFLLMDVIAGNPLMNTIIACLVGHFVHVVRNMVPHRYGIAPFKCPEFICDYSEKLFSNQATFAESVAPRVRPAWAQQGGNRLN